MNPSPVFIGGLYKSGTSLLRAMLGQHSRLASGLETYWFAMHWPGQAPPPDSRGEPLADQLARLSTFFELKKEAVLAWAEAAPSPESFLDTLMSALARRQGKPRWVEKTPGNVLHLDRIFATWPKARFMHIIRDPRDVFASLKRAEKYTGPGEMEALLERFYPAYTAWADDARMLEIRYESLVLWPEPTVRTILEFLGEPFEAQVARFEGAKNDYDKVLAATGKASTTLHSLSKPLFKDRIGFYTNKLDPEEQKRVVATAKNLGRADVLSLPNAPA